MKIDSAEYNYWQDVWNAEFEAEQEELAEQAEAIRAEAEDYAAELKRIIAEIEQ